jgi:hypothetical protein
MSQALLKSIKLDVARVLSLSTKDFNQDFCQLRIWRLSESNHGPNSGF